MNQFLESTNDVLVEVSSFVWGEFLLIPILLAAGIYMTVRLGLLQFIRLLPALRLGLIQRKDEGSSGDISQFQSLTTALAATVGTGNIVGVATAIAVGGPGALFWMWVTGILGMALKYSEAFLGVRFRTTDAAGEKSGGPQYYLERGIRGRLMGPVGKFLAIWFSVFAFLASFGIGNMTQGNSIASNLEHSFNVPTWLTGAVLVVFVGVSLIGGIKSIGKVTSGFVPVMIVFYVAASIYILIVNAEAIPQALGMVFTDAFTGTAAMGGFIGSVLMEVVKMGMARGMFSNESGMGSAAIAAAAAQTSHPVRQGLVSMTQTFIDTIIVVTCTGLVIVTTGVWQLGGDNDPALMTGEAFTTGLPGEWGHYIVTLGLILFASSTMLGWAYYGERNAERLVGRRGVLPYRVLFTAVVFLGCTMELELVWNFADIMNGLMALPNIIGIVILSGLIARETKRYLRHDPNLRATGAEVSQFMADDAGYREWRREEEASESIAAAKREGRMGRSARDAMTP
ncbi:sodium:alanine symporter family protein [Cellulosimicrobium funkei]|nr:sodium:alanine symporter family protein [Cellulosimicrobium funkei]